MSTKDEPRHPDGFASPNDVVMSDLNTTEKRRILEEWEDDLRGRQTATEENMPAAGDDRLADELSSVHEALRKLTEANQRP